MTYMIFPTNKGRYSVRPDNWAFQATKGVVSEDIRHTAIFEDLNLASEYIKYKEAEAQNRLFVLPEGFNLNELDANKLSYAFIHALSLVKYGVDISSERLAQASAISLELSQAYIRGRQDERDRLAALQAENNSDNDSERRY